MKAFISLLIQSLLSLRLTPPHLFTYSPIPSSLPLTLLNPLPSFNSPNSFISPNSFRCVVLCVCLSPASVYLLRLSISCVCLSISCVCLVSFNILSNSSGSIVYHPIHSNALNSISLKSLSGSTCLTGFYWFEVFGVFEVFKGVRRVQRFYSYNTLSKSYNSFSCPYRRNRTI